MNKGKYYILPEGVKVEEIKQTMFSNGDGFAYQDINMAEYSIAIGKMCECGNVIDGKTWTICNSCREKKQNDKFNAFELVEWDNETPLTIFNSDTYFWTPEDLESYRDNEGVKVEDLQLVLCEPNSAPNFDLQDYCEDDLPEDTEIRDYEKKDSKYSVDEIESIVNDFLQRQPISWSGGSKRVLIKEA